MYYSMQLVNFMGGISRNVLEGKNKTKSNFQTESIIELGTPIVFL